MSPAAEDAVREPNMLAPHCGQTSDVLFGPITASKQRENYEDKRQNIPLGSPTQRTPKGPESLRLEPCKDIVPRQSYFV